MGSNPTPSAPTSRNVLSPAAGLLARVAVDVPAETHRIPRSLAVYGRITGGSRARPPPADLVSRDPTPSAIGGTGGSSHPPHRSLDRPLLEGQPMTIVAAADGTYEVDLPLGTTVAETIRTLRAVPQDATLFEHFGDVDLIAVFRLPHTGSDSQP